MAEQIVELYTDADLQGMDRKIRRWRTALITIGALALAACVALILLTNTGNAARMELAVIAVSTVAGWVVIYGGIFVVAATCRELDHAKMLRSEARQTVRGKASVTKERVVIRRSITVRRVTVEEGGEKRRLLVCESRAKALEAAKPAALYIANGYVAAYEVTP